MDWTALLPLRGWGEAKSRLRAASPSDAAHRRLVTALRTDTAAALRASERVARVVVVSSDADCLAWAAGLHLLTVGEPEPGLNPALRHAARVAGQRWPDDGVVALVGDLPAATGPSIDAVLTTVRTGERRFVADRDGTGTTLLAAAAGVALDPRFGAGSAGRHRASGAAVADAPAGLRLDVDTPADLAAVARVGSLGPATRAVLGQVAD